MRFELKERETKRANIDYHVEFDGRHYSVPFGLRQQPIEVRATPGIVECWHKGVRVASHRRSYARVGTAVTLKEHRPKSHVDCGDWPPERMLAWAERFGPHVKEVVHRTMARYPHPEMGYRPVLGILRVAEKQSPCRARGDCLRQRTRPRQARAA